MEIVHSHRPWNKGKLVGQKPPLKPKDIWAIRIHLQIGNRIRELAMFNLAIDSKLRGCDLVNLRVQDVAPGNQIVPRAMVMQRKTQRPVQFELTEPTREAVAAWIAEATSSRISTCSQADCTTHRISRPGSTRESFTSGWYPSGWIRQPIARVWPVRIPLLSLYGLATRAGDRSEPDQLPVAAADRAAHAPRAGRLSPHRRACRRSPSQSLLQVRQIRATALGRPRFRRRSARSGC